MKSKVWMRRIAGLISVMLFFAINLFAEIGTKDSISAQYIPKIGVDQSWEYIFPSNKFLRGNNNLAKPLRNGASTHLKYSFQSKPGSFIDQVHGGAYQGIGIARFAFFNPRELGNPVAVYLFQGGRINPINPRLSLNYEWNFGISFGWKPYHPVDNLFNGMTGSRINAYMNTDLYLSWMLSHQIDLTSGVSLNHFSNGNTKFPNAGLNTVGVKVGLAYNFNRNNHYLTKLLPRSTIQPISPHMTYDLLFFGAWRRKGVPFEGKMVASPDCYTVLGVSFAPLYNFGYRFRAGLSLDGVYDGSANVYTKYYLSGESDEFIIPPLKRQFALGISARGEYVMPYFTIALGLGVNVLHGGGDLKAFYQILALKTEVTRHTYIHIGYTLLDFHTPSYLMLGIGIRFNHKSPSSYR